MLFIHDPDKFHNNGNTFGGMRGNKENFSSSIENKCRETGKEINFGGTEHVPLMNIFWSCLGKMTITCILDL